MPGIPEIDLTDPTVIADPFGAHGRAREQAPLAQISSPGFGPFWATTRHDGAKRLLSDPRFVINSGSFQQLPGIPEHCRAYLRTMSEMDGPEHQRLRRLVSPAFTPRSAAAFRPRIERIVESLLDDLDRHVEGGVVDLVPHFARPLPMDVICELVGIPDADRARWREYGAAVMTGYGPAFLAALPGIMDGAQAAVASRREDPDGDDVLAELVRLQADDGDRSGTDGLGEVELVTLVWHLVIAGQTPTNALANGVAALLAHPDQLAALRADPALMPGAVEELLRWCGPQLMAVPRFAATDVEIEGVVVAAGQPVTASIAGANRDEAVFPDPERLDVTRPAGAQLGFGHGPHYCLGAALAKVECEVAFTALLRRYPRLAAAAAPERAPDPGTWRLVTLPVVLG
ncbi:cytochrome P450 family protein [Pseudonocardia sp. GCM10023141]|uniref:cytochrome P450 family protein n=1 Tax=Pseudonocardia sp. GCM10023141 TaxID=3252653 RepID=UPI00361677AC